ncbi:MFS general substrate transporter [Aureobasidium pullulans]|uniref:MFS general substrate transporter n=1 Tax=Aureobasidium pullulans TaxID=5580 RepID=A0A4S9TG36_AURPU|nr:MFS general substrate transporter [Aureobasidium pullulans]
MGFLSALDRPYINPFYHSQEDEEPDDVVKEESGLTSSSSPSDHSPPYQEAYGHMKTPVPGSGAAYAGEQVDPDYQAGVQKAEGVTLAWNKRALWITYIWIYVVYFEIALMSTITGYLGNYANADFSTSQLLSVSSVMSSIIGGVLRLPTAKIIDIWGRAEGFFVMMCICIIGLIIFAASNNVQTYAAASVIYYIGYDGMYYVMTVFIADTTRLKHRILMLAISQTPFICTAFTTPYAVSSFVSGAGWRWGYGTFAIVTPVACLPLCGIFLYYQRKAEKMGLYKRTESPVRGWYQTIVHYWIEFDMVGVFLLCAGFVLFLLPFSLATSVAGQWKSASIISMLVIGFVILCLFPVWERFGASKPFLPWDKLKDRTVFGSVLCISSLYAAFYCWNLYYYTFNQVVLGLGTRDATYMGEIYTVGSCFFGVITGQALSISGLKKYQTANCFFSLLVKWTKRYKWIALASVPLYIMGTGLLIHFRQPGTAVGYVVMCQIFIAFAGGTLVPCHQVAALAAGTHGEFATTLALLYLASSVGGAIGDSIAGGIWTNVYPGELAKRLPADVATSVYTSYTNALTYPVGSETRDAIGVAFGIAQRDMCIAASSITALTFIAVWIWRDINLANKKQIKGVVV